MAGSLASVPAWAQQLDLQDPYGLQPKPPPAQPAPKAEEKKPEQKGEEKKSEGAPSDEDVKLSPEDIERRVREAQRAQSQQKARKELEEQELLRSLSDGTPTDRLGASLPEIPSFPVKDVLEDPTIFEGQRLRITGVVRRQCQTGCWVEIAEHRSAPTGVRIVPPGTQWKFEPSTRERRITAYGELKKRQLDQKAARALDEAAGEKPKSGPRVEWYLDAEGAEVLWLN
ncbi:MAG: hypothetical protein AB2A00_33820 [Myxococcota bacterium]